MKTLIWLLLPLSIALVATAYTLWSALCRGVARGTTTICCFDAQECAADVQSLKRRTPAEATSR